MKRRTVNTIIYDNDKEHDELIEIVANSVRDQFDAHTDYTIHVGGGSLILTDREYRELRELMDEVLQDAD